MKSFQKIILSLALILLIVILTSFAILLKTSKGDVIYPPMLSVCPDPPSGDNGGYKVVGNECVYEGSSTTQNADSTGTTGSGMGTLTQTTVDECGDFLIDDFKDLTYAEKKKNLKKYVLKGIGMV